MPSDRSPATGLQFSMAVAVWVLATIGTLVFLRAASQLLIPIVLAVLISYALEPVVAWLARHRVPRLAGTTLVLASILALGAWGTYSLRDEALNALESLPRAAQRAREIVTSGADSGPGANIKQAAQALQGEGQAGGGGEPQQQAAAPGPTEGGSLATLVQRGVGWVFAVAGNLVVIVFLVFFLLIAGHHFRNRLIEVAGPRLERRRVTAEVIDEISAQIQRFLLVRIATAAVVALLTWGVLAWMGVANAAVWGILAGVFNSIPYFGPVIVSGGLLLVGLVQGGGLAQGVQMAGAALAITSLEGWLITPPLLGKAAQMSALTVFLGLLLWTWVWGAWGTILAVPMLVVVKSVADRIESLRPVGRLMAP